MNSNDMDREARLQAAAEQAERLAQPAGIDPELDRHRLVVRALNRPTALQLPADFAARVAARVGFGEDKGSAEDWVMTLLMGVLGVVGLVYLQPVLATALQRVNVDLPHLPWPMLGATAVALVVAWAVDRGASRGLTSAR